jgi:hypothetical protein
VRIRGDEFCDTVLNLKSPLALVYIIYRRQQNIRGLTTRRERTCSKRKDLYREKGLVQREKIYTRRKDLHREKGLVQEEMTCTGRKDFYREKGIVKKKKT